MFLGTHADNMADCAAKGRRAKGGQIHNAKLTDADVRTILARQAGGESESQLAREYGVNVTTISRIICQRRWKHITASYPRVTPRIDPIPVNGAQIRNLRQERGLSQPELLRKADLHIDVAWLSRIECGVKRSVVSRNVRALAQALEVPLEMLLAPAAAADQAA
jgi:transcriptional regulator with XRE-family HTH domain